MFTFNPFGEKLEEQGTFYTPWQFTGQFLDSETGMYYLRARQYSPYLSRFTGRDLIIGSFEEPMTLHKYLYCGNNPINAIDPSGLWMAPIHNELFKREFSGTVPGMFMHALEQGSNYVDTNFQAPKYSYMHAMRAGAISTDTAEQDQTPEEAQRLMYDFMLQEYVTYRSLLSKGRTGEAYFALGMAMHPIMDSTNPQHVGFQKWNIGVFGQYKHWRAEPKSIDQVDRATVQWTLDLMNQTLTNLDIAYELGELWDMSS
jgi:RHS repeat-associated protein